MKRLTKRIAITLCCLFLTLGALAQGTPGGHIVISGTVRDQASGTRLEDVSIGVPGTNIGTVTNADGYFTLKVKEKPEYILLSSIGYKSGRFLLDRGVENLKISLTPNTLMLKELTIYAGEGENLIHAALQKRRENNVQTTEMQTSFYRETIQKGSRFIDIAEAVLSSYKTPYAHGISADRVKVEQGRRLVSQRGKDTISVKVLGGPTMPITLDAVKNDVVLFDEADWMAYKYEVDEPVLIDDNPQIVINFTPIGEQPWALYYGKIYLDRQTLAFTRIEMSLDMRNQAKAIKHMLYRKPVGLRFRPRELSTVICYRNGRIHYMKTTFRFHCDWKKKLIATNYTAVSEMVVTDVQENYKGPKIVGKERFSERDSFHDAVQYFSDPDFWGAYNIIEPTESLEKAVSRLKKAR